MHYIRLRNPKSEVTCLVRFLFVRRLSDLILADRFTSGRHRNLYGDVIGSWIALFPPTVASLRTDLSLRGRYSLDVDGA